MCHEKYPSRLLVDNQVLNPKAITGITIEQNAVNGQYELYVYSQDWACSCIFRNLSKDEADNLRSWIFSKIKHMEKYEEDKRAKLEVQGVGKVSKYFFRKSIS